MLQREFVQTFNDWLKWYNYNARQSATAGLPTQVEFLQKAVRGLFFVSAAMADEMARIDNGSEKDERVRILIPADVRWS